MSAPGNRESSAAVSFSAMARDSVRFPARSSPSRFCSMALAQIHTSSRAPEVLEPVQVFQGRSAIDPEIAANRLPASRPARLPQRSRLLRQGGPREAASTAPPHATRASTRRVRARRYTEPRARQRARVGHEPAQHTHARSRRGSGRRGQLARTVVARGSWSWRRRCCRFRLERRGWLDGRAGARVAAIRTANCGPATALRIGDSDRPPAQTPALQPLLGTRGARGPAGKLTPVARPRRAKRRAAVGSMRGDPRVPRALERTAARLAARSAPQCGGADDVQVTVCAQRPCIAP